VPLPAAAAGAQIPPYYVSLVYSPSYGFAAPGPVVVRSTATGRVLTTVAPPRGEEFTGVSGAADDTTFVLAAETPGQVARRMRDRTWARGLLADAMPDRFYLLRFDATTDTVRVTPLPIPTLPHASDFALSPDGTSLAVASATVSKITVSVYPLTAGPVHTWTEGTHQGGQYRWLAAWGLSWIQGSQLAFTLGPQAAKGQPTIGWLNTAASGGNLLSDSYVFPPGPCAGDTFTPDGNLAIGGVASGGGFPVTFLLQECAISLGRARVIVPHLAVRYDGGTASVQWVQWTSPGGQTIVLTVGSGPSGLATGVLEGHDLDALPAPSPIPFNDPFPGNPVSW
jgi:hypothetical protein